MPVPTFSEEMDAMDGAFEDTGSMPDTAESKSIEAQGSTMDDDDNRVAAPVSGTPIPVPPATPAPVESPAAPIPIIGVTPAPPTPVEAPKAPEPVAPAAPEVPVVAAPATPVVTEDVSDPRLQAALEEVRRLSALVGPQGAPTQGNAPVTPAAPLSFFDTEGEKAEENLAEIITDPKKFNGLFVKAVETAVAAMPAIASRIVQQQLDVSNQVQWFWLKNEDLAPHARYVATVTEEVEAANPGLSIGEIFKKAGDVSRERLMKMGMLTGAGPQRPVVAPPVTPAPKVPAAPVLPVRMGSGGPPSMPNLSEFEKDTAAMDEALKF